MAGVDNTDPSQNGCFPLLREVMIKQWLNKQTIVHYELQCAAILLVDGGGTI
jgi:hypothetical protein